MKWITLSPNAIKNLDYGTFMMVARPDGKSWSGTLDGSDANGFILKNGNIRTELTFARNPTASYLVIPRPKWNLEFGTQRLRSEEHTSELQSLMRISYAVFCLKKKKTTIILYLNINTEYN